MPFFVLADTGDWITLVVVVITLIMSWLAKLTQKNNPEEQPSSPSSPSKKPEEATLDDWLKELSGEKNKAAPPPPLPSQRKPAPPAQHPPPDPRRAYERPFSPGPPPPLPQRPRGQPPPIIRSTPRPPAVPVHAKKPVHEPSPPSPLIAETSKPSAFSFEHPAIHEEIHRFSEKLQSEIEIERSELVPPPVQASSVPSRLEIALLRSPSGLRQAIVAAEILGKPRALSDF